MDQYIFEASWEVCNKVGGIYTVLSTKAKSLQRLFKDRVIFIGPDLWSADNEANDFIQSDKILTSWCLNAGLPEGVSIRIGRWQVPGRPIVILVKFAGLYESKNEFYARMWERFGVDSLHGYGDYDEACAFSRAAAEVIKSLAAYLSKRRKYNFIAHFNEWTTGMGLLEVKRSTPEIAIVFTTHATCIGRSICGNGKELYQYLRCYDGDQMARELNMEAKHSLEKIAAREADCFTTVSDVTADECEQLLGRRPDVITPNGFEPGFVPPVAKFKGVKSAARSKLLQVANALTGRDLGSDTFLFCTSGRCEYRNKGIDVFCDAVALLNTLSLKGDAVGFVMVPAWSAGARSDLSAALSDGVNIGVTDPVLTHNLHNFNEDLINQHIHRLGFANCQYSGKVSLIYVPVYLNGNDGIFNRSYYDLLIGMDATVFPSYYEPWGYTPLESIAFGVPTITTSLSGFGRWVKTAKVGGLIKTGVEVVERDDCNRQQCVERIADTLKLIAESDHKFRVSLREAAIIMSTKADWQHFINYYLDAFRIARNNNDNIN